MKTPLYWFLQICLIYFYIKATGGHMTEILVEDEVTAGVRGNSVEPIPPEEPVTNSCHVEFQVMKRVLGRCVKLGRNSHGCMAGTYINPFHPECM